MLDMTATMTLVSEMRNAQRMYFRTRNDYWLAESKRLEHQINMLIDNSKQPGLFDGPDKFTFRKIVLDTIVDLIGIYPKQDFKDEAANLLVTCLLHHLDNARAYLVHCQKSAEIDNEQRSLDMQQLRGGAMPLYHGVYTTQ